MRFEKDEIADAQLDAHAKEGKAEMASVEAAVEHGDEPEAGVEVARVGVHGGAEALVDGQRREGRAVDADRVGDRAVLLREGVGADVLVELRCVVDEREHARPAVDGVAREACLAALVLDGRAKVVVVTGDSGEGALAAEDGRAQRRAARGVDEDARGEFCGLFWECVSEKNADGVSN